MRLFVPFVSVLAVILFAQPAFAQLDCEVDNNGGGGGENLGDIWLDRTTELEWQVKLSDNAYDHGAAEIRCDELELEGGGWRLPTISELRTTIRPSCSQTQAAGSCGVTDNNCTESDCAAGTSCIGCPTLSTGCYIRDELNGCGPTWSATQVIDDPASYWMIEYDHAGIYTADTERTQKVRCVRDEGATNDDDDDGDDDSDDDADNDDDDEGDDDGGDDDDDDDNGVWLDPTSGYEWPSEPPTIPVSWDDAVEYCDNLTLDGGDWHLPTITELRTLIHECDNTNTGGSCEVSDSCTSSECWDGEDCTCDEYPSCYDPYVYDICSDVVWSSTPVSDLENTVWYIDFRYAGVNTIYKSLGGMVTCVRLP
ncbi:MAG: DUF1566 domain-containing protein [Deltaproteobacteria bacterium]|nr:DUF1566 domain-containing protein [bacterium]MCB9476939.1 DUF1566 domain-containing protein [Deltaproteobacteria bacterium]MCB9478681.1 DUF1566 domain-containing protein [Deltaproteobacteria bacterium]MCB9489789.1 DUF1566 domain-containing protein [Deltaproteobacteria bacterium]